MNVRWHTAVLLLLPVALVSQAPVASQASVQGIVADRVSSEGIVGASLLLTGIVEDRVVSFTTKTAAGGRFTFDKVPPSSGYWLVATDGEHHMRTIYQQRGLNGTGAQIPVASGQEVRDIRVTMVPTGQISGRIIDSAGKPVSDAQVLILKPTYSEAGRALYAAKSFVRTNRRGEYVVSGLTPGPYYVRVAINNGECNLVFHRDERLQVPVMPDRIDLAGLRPVGCTESEGYPYTYFPGTAEERLARSVDLRAGSRGDSIDVVVSKVHIRRVRGLVVNTQTGLTVPSQLLWFRTGAVRGSPPLLTVESTDGTFDVRNILPGSYTIVALSKNGNPILRGSLAVNIATADLNDLRIPVTEGFELKGKVLLSPPGNANGPSSISVTLRPEAPSTLGLLPSPTFLATEAQGDFVYFESGLRPTLEIPPIRNNTSGSGDLEFRGISPWRYTVEVRQTAEDVYVKNIRLGNVDVLAEGLHVENSSQGELEIELAAPAGRIEGSVIDVERKPIRALRVVLLPDAFQGRAELFQNTLTGDEGHFHFGQLSPGDYKLFAWEFAENGSWLDSDFMRLYIDKGVPIHVEEGSTQKVEISPIPPWY